MCGLAHTCVFAKQSLGPIHCDPPERWARGPGPTRASLLPKLRDHYAEFLDPVSLVHLRLLAAPTCVGLRYGRPQALPRPAFLDCRLHTTRPLPRECPRHPVSASCDPYAVRRPLPRGRSCFVPVSLIWVKRTWGGAGIFAGCPSVTPLGPHLRVRLTLR